MKRRVLIALVVVLALAATASLVWAGGGGPTKPSGESHIGHLYLNEKIPSGLWPIVEDGAWGKMKYNLWGPTFNFVFNGHGLNPGDGYTLIYYPDKTGNPWPRVDVICLGSGTANGGGNVHIRDSADTGDLPDSTVDINTGAKIWLVLSDDVDCEDPAEMAGWNPTEYLFEYDLITFTDVP